MSVNKEAISRSSVNKNSIEDGDGESSSWMKECKYTAFHLNDLRSEIVVLQECMREYEAAWEAEVSLYEADDDDDDEEEGEDEESGCRNYMNEEKKVLDVQLFPYDDRLYPLLECYAFDQKQSPRDEDDDDEETESDEAYGSMPCPWSAMREALHPNPTNDITNDTNSTTNDITNDSNDNSAKQDVGDESEEGEWEDIDARDSDVLEGLGYYSFPHGGCLPVQSPLVSQHVDADAHDSSLRLRFSDGPLLLKVLRHATSDLQRDHILASSTLLTLTRLQCCNDPHILRGLIATIDAEYPHECQGSCQHHPRRRHTQPNEPLTHSCQHVQLFLQSISTLLTHGITHYTATHATILSAWFLSELNQISAADIDDAFFDQDASPTTLANAQSAASSVAPVGSFAEQKLARRKILLKQNLYHYGEVPMRFKGRLLREIILAVARKAALDRMRLQYLLQHSSSSSQNDSKSCYQTLYKQRKQIYQSYLQTIRTLVSISESALRRLPQNDIARELGGLLLRGFVDAFVDLKLMNTKDDQEWRAQREVPPCHLLHCTRYARAVTHANELWKQETKSHENTVRFHPTNSHNQQDKAWIVTPPQDVQHVVRAMFVRDLVSISVSGYGYGDWLCLMRLPITPLDPLLFDSLKNYVDQEEDEDEDHGRGGGGVTSSGGGAVPPLRYIDEDGVDVKDQYLAARYDFSLLLLIRAWRAPWTPSSHRSFQPPFRQAAQTLAMCFHRLALPAEIVTVVCSFMPRDGWGWDDERKQCWYHDCQMKNSIQMMRTIMANREKESAAEEEGRQKVGDQKDSLVPDATPSTHAPLETPQENGKASTPASAMIHTCKKCKVVLYCGKEHKRYLMQEWHRRVCGCPPYRIQGKEEDQLCQTVMEYDGSTHSCDLAVEESNLASDEQQENNDEEEEDDDDSCWESVDSNEEEEELSEDGVNGGFQRTKRTERVFKFFYEQAYKGRAFEAPAFSNFFNTE